MRRPRYSGLIIISRYDDVHALYELRDPLKQKKAYAYRHGGDDRVNGWTPWGNVGDFSDAPRKYRPVQEDDKEEGHSRKEENQIGNDIHQLLGSK
jgi:hypothetical protein